MSTRTITECDRCHGEIRGGVVPRTVDGRDLCSTCSRKLDEFLAGKDLDDDP